MSSPFEAVDGAPRVDKREYAERMPEARTELLRVQYELRDSDFALVVLLAGNDVEGLHDQINILHEWMDARLIDAHAFTEPTDEEAARPQMWRYWTHLPARGRTGIFLGGWSQRRIVARLEKDLGAKGLERLLAHDVAFERTLVADGALVLKLWLHLPADEVKKQKRKSSDTPRALLHRPSLALVKKPAEGVSVAEAVLERTNTELAPWHVIAGLDVEHRRLEVARIVAEALDQRLREGPKTVPAEPMDDAPSTSALSNVDLTAETDKDEYEDELERLQAALWDRWCRAIDAEVPLVLVFEGWDAAGKGGAIRRLTHAMPATSYRVVRIGAPDTIERAHPWQWRFWRSLPRRGRCTIFDRSWYGRVLVERVEGFAIEEAWSRGFGEITDLEQQIVESGAVLRKFWLHISPEEQLRRFEKRETVPFKKYKITADDYRNRGRWEDYAVAVDEMIARTSGAEPWHVVAAEDKRTARLTVLRTVLDALKERV